MLKRIILYFTVMYPPLPRLIVAGFMAVGVHFLYQSMMGLPVIKITGGTILGTAATFLILLFLRVSDELKDYEVDKILFPERPVSKGEIKLVDLKVLWYVSLALVVIINIIWPYAVIPFVAIIIFTLLMYKYFFLPQYISKSLILAVLTHNPGGIILNVYLIALFTIQNNMPLFSKETVFVSVWFWLPFLIWEISRKIRDPKDEDDYETYSKIFGYKIAAIIPVILILIHYAMMIFVKDSFNVSFYFILSYSVAVLIAIAFFVKFIIKPFYTGEKLKMVAEVYTLLVYLGMIIDIVLANKVLVEIL